MNSSKRKNRKQKAAIIRINEVIQILLFLIICFYMATCGALHKEVTMSSENVSVKGNNSSKRASIVRFAKKYEGTPYQYAGRSPKGFDCSGFTYYVMKEFGVKLSPVSRIQENEGTFIPVKDVQPGDLLFFRRSKNGTVFHVGLVVSNDNRGIKMIHSSSSRGVVIDNIQENSYWRSKVATAREVVD